MREKIIGILICIMMFSTVAGGISSINMLTESSENEAEPEEKRSYTHDILGEYGTMTTCVPCKYAHRALKYLYENKTTWDIPFYYITYVYNKNNHSYQRIKTELDLQASPTVYWDGGYKADTGATEVEKEMGRYNDSLIACGNRNVKDIDLSLDVEWLGAVNNVPSDGASGVPVEQTMRWNNSEFKIDIGVDCNETGLYNGHLHIQVTEVESEWYNDKFGEPYTFEFKDWAYNDDVSFSGGGSWSETIYWDGCDHNDLDSPPRYFNHIKQDNIMVIATIYDEDNDNYMDETTGFRAGIGTDPKLYDIYFGKTNPPTKRLSNFSYTTFNNGSLLEFDTTYYWKVDVWNELGEVTNGTIWNFKTRTNNPPNEPSPVYPPDNSTGIEINTSLTWSGGDPDFDAVTYDVYFGEGISDPPQVAENQTNLTYNPPGILNFNKPYTWKIVAWDLYGEKAESDLFTFKTQGNLPPNTPSNPNPANGSNGINTEANITWIGGDPNPGDPITYDVYFGVTNPPTKKVHNQSEETWDPGTMEEQKKYYWYIVSWDSKGETATGPIWSFTTGVPQPPTAPIIDGPNTGTEDVEYEFTIVSTDPNNDLIRYYINWDDGNTEWTELHVSGEVVTVNHTWTHNDLYTITVKPQDEYGDYGPESTKKFRVPRNKAIYNPFIFQLMEQLLARFPIIRQLLGL